MYTWYTWYPNCSNSHAHLYFVLIAYYLVLSVVLSRADYAHRPVGEKINNWALAVQNIGYGISATWNYENVRLA